MGGREEFERIFQFWLMEVVFDTASKAGNVVINVISYKFLDLDGGPGRI